MGISFSISSSQSKTTTTPSQSLTNLFEVLTVNSEMLTTPSEAVITPFETLLTLWGPSTPPSPSLLCNCYTIWSPHHPLLAPWQSGTISLITPEIILGQGLQKLCWGPQRVWECIRWSRAGLKCGIKDLGWGGRTSEDVGGLQKEW